MPKYKVTIRESTLYTYEVEADDVDIAEDEAFNKHLVGESSQHEELDPEVVEVKIV
jgi:hypothetical protein